LSVGRAKRWEFGYAYKIQTKVIVFLLKEVFDMEGIRFDEIHDYVCKCDRAVPEAEKAIFRVRFLTALEQAQLRDEMYSVSGIGEGRSEKFLTGTSALKALKIGLKGWANFNYKDKSPIEYNEANISAIPPAERDEIANYIRGTEEGF